jgi:hypothetical protein
MQPLEVFRLLVLFMVHQNRAVTIRPQWRPARGGVRRFRLPSGRKPSRA